MRPDPCVGPCPCPRCQSLGPLHPGESLPEEGQVVFLHVLPCGSNVILTSALACDSSSRLVPLTCSQGLACRRLLPHLLLMGCTYIKTAFQGPLHPPATAEPFVPRLMSTSRVKYHTLAGGERVVGLVQIVW